MSTGPVQHSQRKAWRYSNEGRELFAPTEGQQDVVISSLRNDTQQHNAGFRGLPIAAFVANHVASECTLATGFEPATPWSRSNV
jgi:hypothetical protein